jgi:phosphoesterase RecJ-like protein
MSLKKDEPDPKIAEWAAAMERLYDELVAAKRLIEGNESFIIAVHVRPDPDAVGSALALARAIRHLGKRAVVISSDGVPDICSYLPDADTVLTNTQERGFDVAVVCDAASLDRVGSAAEVLASARSLFLIDHHPQSTVASTNVEQTGFRETLSAIADWRSSTAEIVFQLLHQFRGMRLDAEMSRQLMAGIVGDTGAFRFANTRRFTLAVAQWLMEFGATISEAAKEIYENRTLANTRLLGAALLAAQVEEDGKVVWSHITQEDFARFEGSDKDTDGIVNQLTAMKGVQVGLLFREIEPNRIRVSLRSTGSVDVNRIARAFGGGGHAAAAGCTIEANLEKAEKAVLAEVRAWMES